MPPIAILGLQTGLSFVAFTLLIRWHLGPRLASLPIEDRLTVLTWPHVFRYVALTGLLPGQTASDMPAGPLAAVVWGDTLSAILALAAVVMLRARAPGAIAMAWIFNLVGLADWAQSQAQGMGARLFERPLGAAAYVFVFYVPLLVVTHVTMLWMLARRGRVRPD